MGSTESQNEIAALEERLRELRKERASLEAEVERSRVARGRARLAGDAEKALANLRKAEEAASRALEEINIAIEAGSAEIIRLQKRAEAERQAERSERDVAEQLAIAAALPTIADKFDEVLALVDAAAGGSRRAILFGEIALAFRSAVDRSNAGRPASVRDALADLAAAYRKSAAQSTAAPVRQVQRLVRDTPVYVKRGFRYRDAGDRERLDVTIGNGNILLVPAVVADAAERAGLVEVLPQDTDLARIELLRSAMIEGRAHSADWVGIVPVDVAAPLIASGTARPLERLLDREIAAYRPGRPVDRPGFGATDLGVFNDPAADGARAMTMATEVAA